MGKCTYRFKEKGSGYDVIYSGDLKDVVEKVRKDLEKERNNPDMKHYEWIFKKAQSFILAHNRKIQRLESFIDRAENILMEKESSEAEKQNT